MLASMSRPAHDYTRRTFLGRAAVAAAAPGVAAAVASCGGSSPAAHGVDQVRRHARLAHHPVHKSVPENERPGDPGWWISSLGAPDAIAGYAGQASVRPGEPADLYVSTTAREFTVRAFRIGWYGGDLARKVWESGPVRGHRQRAPARLATMRLRARRLPAVQGELALTPGA